MTDNEIIKACPFCGEKAHLDRHDIFCDCGAKITIPLYVDGKESVSGFLTYKEARKEMIEAWNSRVEEETISQQKAKIDSLKADRHELLKLVERLKAEKDNLIRTYAECQAEVVKEFAERLKKKIDCDVHTSEGFYFMVQNAIDNLLKETVGDANDK